MTNPLIDQGSLLNWPAIKTEHITPALDELLAKANEAVAKVTAPETPATWLSRPISRHSGMNTIPGFPSFRFRTFCARPFPSGVTSPRPVTTTLFVMA